MDRRAFVTRSAMLAAGGATGGASARAQAAPASPAPKAPLYKISLAQWSLNKTLFAKQLDNLEFAKTANGLGIDAVEYVNQFFKDKARDKSYLAEMKKRAAGEGVWSVLIMIDGEGNFGAPEEAKRKEAVENHKKWIDAAAYLGCHTIRVNARGDGPAEEQARRVAECLRKLGEYGDPMGISVTVENHGGLSSDADWLMGVMKAADHPRVGTLPDFGNFPKDTDRYRAVEQMMPVARSVSAKSMAFDKKGNETETDYLRMMKIVVQAGYRGYVGIEFSGGGKMSEIDGIVATKRLLERVRAQLAKSAA